MLFTCCHVLHRTTPVAVHVLVAARRETCVSGYSVCLRACLPTRFQRLSAQIRGVYLRHDGQENEASGDHLAVSLRADFLLAGSSAYIDLQLQDVTFRTRCIRILAEDLGTLQLHGDIRLQAP